MTPLVDRDDCRFYHADWRELAATVGHVDALIVDAPYSERTHAGHSAGLVPSSKTWVRQNGKTDRADSRRDLDYAAWTPADVRSFVGEFSALCSGWIVSITDDQLAPHWHAALVECGRYAFAPIVFVAPGSRVRLTGDGPSNWITWIVVARPKTKEAARWGTLPGAYVLPPGHSERMPVVGGKPLWLMERLVEDYSRPGDLVCDPCAGAGTTGLAALRTGRRFVGGDAMREHADIAARALSQPQQQPLFAVGGGV